MQELTNKKRELRKQILAMRKALSEDEVSEKSAHILNNLFLHPAFIKADSVTAYVPINNEVDIASYFDKILEYGKKLYLPKVLPDNRMEFYRFTKDTTLKEGAFHILEPESDEQLVADKNTLVILPGAVFSVFADRIGYGGGFYDRYLASNSLAMTVALAYDFQILSCDDGNMEFPVELTDIRPDYVIGEERQYENPRRNRTEC